MTKALRKARFALTTFVFVWCIGCGGGGGSFYGSPLDRFDVEKFDWYAILPSAQYLVDRFLSFVVNTEGMLGLLDVVESWTGIELWQDDVLSKHGVEPNSPLVLFGKQNWVVVSFAIKDKSRFLESVLDVANHALFEVELYESEFGRVILARKGENEIAVGCDHDICLVVVGRKALVGLSKILVSKVERTKVEKKLKDVLGRVNLRKLFSRGEVHDSLGLAFSGCTEMRFRFSMNGEVHANATLSCPEMQDRRICQTAEQFLPKDTILEVCAGLSGSKLEDALQTTWGNIARALLETLGLEFMDEEFWGLIGKLTSQVCVFLLGFDSSTTFADLTSIGSLERLLECLRIGVVLRGEQDRTEELFSKIVAGSGCKQRLDKGKKESVKLCEVKRGKLSVGVVYRPGTIIFVSGRGQGARIKAVLEGKSQPMSSALFSKLETGGVVVQLKTRSLVRQLQAKGVPIYFLKILGSVMEARFVLDERRGAAEWNAQIILQ